MDISSALKKLLPSLAFFVLGLFIGYKLTPDQSITSGIIMGWCLGGSIWGWFLLRKWLPPKSHDDGTPQTDTNMMLSTIMLVFRIFASVAVGLIAMPVGLIQFIISLFMIKKERDAVIANKTENDQGV
jgi:lipid-A-disaccharide synthase-like uncharacterized protein